MLLLLILAPFLVSQTATEAFLPSRVPRVTPSTALAASAGKKKRRRRRKTPTTEDVVKQLPLDDDEEEGEAVDIATEKDFKVDNEPPTGFDFQPPKADAPMIPPGKTSRCKLIHEVCFDQCINVLTHFCHYSLDVCCGKIVSFHRGNGTDSLGW